MESGALLSLLSTVTFALSAFAIGRRGRRLEMSGGAADVRFETMRDGEGREFTVWVIPISVKLDSGVTLTELRLYPRRLEGTTLWPMMRLSFTPPRPRVDRHKVPQNVLSGLDLHEARSKFETHERLKFPYSSYGMRPASIARATAAGFRAPGMPPYPSVDSDLFEVDSGLFDRLLESVQFRESVKLRELHYGRMGRHAWSRRRDDPAHNPRIVMEGHDIWLLHNQRRVACNMPELPLPDPGMRDPDSRDGTWDVDESEEDLVIDMQKNIQSSERWNGPQVLQLFRGVREAIAKHFPGIVARDEPTRRCSQCPGARKDTTQILKNIFVTKWFFASGRHRWFASREWLLESDGETLTPLGEIWIAMARFAGAMDCNYCKTVTISPRIIANLYTICFDPNHSAFALWALQQA